MTGRMIEVASPADGFVFGAYHVPAKGHRRGGLVLIQEIFGINDNIKKTSDAFAAEGYEVIAPSMYDRIEKGFIRAETISYADYDRLGGEVPAKEAGKMRLEGKDYVVADGDVMHFRFAT